MFLHKDIHQSTCKSPDGKSSNQHDHVFIQTRYRKTICVIRSHRGTDYNTDHYLVIAKLRSKRKKQAKLKPEKRTKINLELLKDKNAKKRYENYSHEEC